MYAKAKVGEDRFVKVGEYNLHYVEAGQGEPAILIPGSFSTYRAWDRLMPLLQRDCRLLALDYLGTGDSDKPTSGFRYTIQEQAGLVAQMIETLDLGPVNLIGASYGGAIVLYLAAVYPQVVKRVFSIEGGILPPEKMPSSALDGILKSPLLGNLFIWLSRSGVMDATFVKWFSGEWYSTMSAEDKQEMLEQIRFNARSATRIAWHWIAISPQTCSQDFAEAAKSIRAPLLYLYGEGSDFMDALVKENVNFIRAHLPHAQIVALPGGIHDMAFQKPQAVAALVLDFFRCT